MTHDRNYWRVSPRFWASTSSWSDDARLVALYLLTCPHRTTEGLFRLPLAYAAADLGWPLERLGKPFGELLAEGFCAYDETAAVILIVNALDYQAPENPNQVKAAVRKLTDLPRTPLTSQFKRLAERFCKPLAEGLPEGFGEGLPEPQALSLAPALAQQPPSCSTTNQGRPQAGGGIVETVNEAARLLAEAEADRRGSEIGNRPGYVKSRAPVIAAANRATWTATLELHPATTAAQLANPSPLDGTQAAARRRADENAAADADAPEPDQPTNLAGIAEARAARNR